MGATVDGYLMGDFYVPSKRRTVYFLWDIVTGLIVESDESGRKLSNKAWLNCSPHRFVRSYWGGEVSSFSHINIFGHPLPSFKCKCCARIISALSSQNPRAIPS